MKLKFGGLVSARAIGAFIACFWVGMEAQMTVGIDEAEGHYREALQAMHAMLVALEAGTARRRRRAPAQPAAADMPRRPR